MKALIVGVIENSREEALESVRELKELIKSLGGQCVGYILQRRYLPDQRFYVGAGKLQEIKLVLQGINAQAVVFDAFLTPSQVANLERELNLKVLDRASLVLEIFSQRVRSKTAKLQVELARLTYELPRLYGGGDELSRLGGGVGTRGPGEQSAEIKRRAIKRRIGQIKRELEQVKTQRREQRKRREVGHIIRAVLVGYTNAGKSSLMRAITGRQAPIENMPFSSLDTLTSARVLSGELKLLLTDTVGFIRKLPPELIESFKATLEELTEADIILHVIDISDKSWFEKVNVVKSVLSDLGAQDTPVIYVFNKADKVVSSPSQIELLTEPAFVDSKAVVVSALKGWGIDKLLEILQEEGMRLREVGA
ncbi:MAG: GTPase HflX [Aquificaceae bacterium]|nr:GTPase HflX [Aquificaceae bacterium]